MPENYRTPRETLRLLPAALLLSIAGLSLARPAEAAEVRYDPGDKVYFTYCHSHPPAMRIKPGDSVITSTRDASNDAFSVSDTSVAPKLDLTKVNPQTGPFDSGCARPNHRSRRGSPVGLIGRSMSTLESGTKVSAT